MVFTIVINHQDQGITLTNRIDGLHHPQLRWPHANRYQSNLHGVIMQQSHTHTNSTTTSSRDKAEERLGERQRGQALTSSRDASSGLQLLNTCTSLSLLA
jgi:hypothetical protein